MEGQELAVLRGATKLLEARRVKAVYLDGYKDRAVKRLLTDYGFDLFDGGTFQPSPGHVFTVMAIHRDWLPGLHRPEVR